MSEPFTENEKAAWDALGAACAAFFKLSMSHPSHMADFVNGMHACQGVLGNRLLQRDYPEIFATYAQRKDGSWVLVKPNAPAS